MGNVTAQRHKGRTVQQHKGIKVQRYDSLMILAIFMVEKLLLIK
jgi:hypothetical protein